MSREEIINLYTLHKRSKTNKKLTTPDLQKKKRCGLKRLDTGGACRRLLTRNREAHNMSPEHGNVTVVCPYCNCQMLQVTYYQRHERQCQEMSGKGSSEFIRPTCQTPADYDEFTKPPIQRERLHILPQPLGLVGGEDGCQRLV